MLAVTEPRPTPEVAWQGGAMDHRRLIAVLILGMPIWAMLAVKLFLVELAGFLLLARLSSQRQPSHQRVVVPFPAFLLALVGAVLGASALVQVGEAPEQRLAGALYNSLQWVAAAAVTVAVANLEADRNDGPGWFVTTLQWFGCLLGVPAALSAMLWLLGNREFTVVSPIYNMIADAVGDIPALRAASSWMILIPDWLFIELPRSAGFMVYPTAFGAAAACALVAAYTDRPAGRSRRWLRRAALAGSAVALLMSLARMAILATIAVCVSLFLWERIVVKRSARFVAGLLLILAGLTLVVGLTATGNRLAAGILESRAGSTTTRSAVWIASLEAWRSSPIIGIGYKPHDFDLAGPVGSHSTVLGLLVKGGALALAAYAGVVAWVLLGALPRLVKDRADRRGWRAPAAVLGAVLALCAWTLVEDLDAPQAVPLLFALLLGLLSAASVRRSRLAGPSRIDPALFSPKRGALNER